jgi:hypothetical protein
LKQGEIENSFLARMTPEQDELFLNGWQGESPQWKSYNEKEIL